MSIIVFLFAVLSRGAVGSGPPVCITDIVKMNEGGKQTNRILDDVSLLFVVYKKIMTE